jgi:hypothetical protein
VPSQVEEVGLVLSVSVPRMHPWHMPNERLAGTSKIRSRVEIVHVQHWGWGCYAHAPKNQNSDERIQDLRCDKFDCRRVLSCVSVDQSPVPVFLFVILSMEHDTGGSTHDTATGCQNEQYNGQDRYPNLHIEAIVSIRRR